MEEKGVGIISIKKQWNEWHYERNEALWT